MDPASALRLLRSQARDRKRWHYRFKMALISRAEKLLNFAISRLPDRWKVRVLIAACREYGVELLVANGAQGHVEGSLRDEGVFVPYLKGKGFTPYISQHIKKLTSQYGQGTYIDIGANIGLTTIPIALTSSWDIHAIEPDPFNKSLLERNLLRNEVRGRVQIHSLAVSDSSGKISLRRSPTNFGDFRITKDFNGQEFEDHLWDSIEVPTKKLDQIFELTELKQPIIIKVDTQGAEPLVFMGGRGIFGSTTMVVMEFWPEGMLRLGQDPLVFLKTLAESFGEFEALEVFTGRTIANSFDDVQKIVEELLRKRSSHYFDLILTDGRKRQGADNGH